MERYFEKEKKELKSSIIRKSILIFMCGVVCTAYSVKAIVSFIEGDAPQGIIFFMPVLIWAYLAVVNVIYIRKIIETSLKFLKNMVEIDRGMAEHRKEVEKQYDLIKADMVEKMEEI